MGSSGLKRNRPATPICFTATIKYRVKTIQIILSVSYTHLILGFLYLKTEDESENYSDITPVFKPMRRLKVGTFKVEAVSYTHLDVYKRQVQAW